MIKGREHQGQEHTNWWPWRGLFCHSGKIGRSVRGMVVKKIGCKKKEKVWNETLICKSLRVAQLSLFHLQHYRHHCC
jgi:hypothetical protein